MIGIYNIKNKINNKIYVGESFNIERRWREHIEDLNNNKHHSYKLQTDWNKYGENNFEFVISRNVDNENIPRFLIEFVLLVYEDSDIVKYDSINKGYNCERTINEILNGKKLMITNNCDSKKACGVLKNIINNCIKNNGTYLSKEENKIKKKIDKNIKLELANKKAIDLFKCKIEEIEEFDNIVDVGEYLYELNIKKAQLHKLLMDNNIIDGNKKLIKEYKNIKNINYNIEYENYSIGFDYIGLKIISKIIVDNYNNYSFFAQRYLNTLND